MKSIAFVTHHDCSRHDTGWGHPDHQGRLPALSRAVYRDMLTLHESLLDVEGRHASADELRLVHTDRYLETIRGWVADARRRGEVIEPVEGIRVSSATWEASTAAVGCALTATDLVVEGRVRNAFCAIRPSGQYVGRERPGRFGLLNPVAVAASYLVRHHAVTPILIVELGGAAGTATAEIFEGSREVEVIGVYEEVGDDRAADGPGRYDLLNDRINAALGRRKPAFVVLSTDFSGLATDPVGNLRLEPRDYFDETRVMVAVAEGACEGRLVSILGGGYDPEGLGSATVEHLRALAGLLPASTSS